MKLWMQKEDEIENKDEIEKGKREKGKGKMLGKMQESEDGC